MSGLTQGRRKTSARSLDWFPIPDHGGPMSGALERIERGLGGAGIVERLAALRRSDLTTLLMAVISKRSAAVSPIALLDRFRQDAFVAPASADPRRRVEFERFAYEAAAAFDPVDLSPLAPLGTCAAVAPVSANLIEHTTRGREVVSDPSNVLALEAARRRAGRMAEEGKRAAPVRLCTSHRVVRTPRASGLGMLQHFGIFALLTSGRSRAGVSFELESIREHIRAHLSLMAHAGVGRPRVTLYDRSACQKEQLEQQVLAPLCEVHDLVGSVRTDRSGARTYYPGLSFQLDCDDTGANIADGGVVDWTARLLSNDRECCIISGCGIDRLLHPPAVAT